jgi:hypothetical protein
MTKTSTKTIELLKLHVAVIHRDIKEGECRLPAKCMHKVATERALRDIDPKGGDHKVRIDAGIVKCNLDGHHWEAILPKVPKKAQIKFDHEEKARKRAIKRGEQFHSKVQPHKFVLELIKGSKIIAFTAERMKQIYDARERQKREGRLPPRDYNLRKRVAGLAVI